MNLRNYLPDIRSSGLLVVAAGFGLLSIANAGSLLIGLGRVLSFVNSSPVGPVLAVLVFDTPWTIAGLVGLVMLFSPVLFGTPVAGRRSTSFFFLAASFVIGIAAGAVWDRFYDDAGVIGAGASGIAIAGQGIVFGLAIVGLVRLARQDTRSLGRMSSYWWHSFVVIYATLILTTVWFVVQLQPIFTPTLLYNWRVHEIAFLLAVCASLVYGVWAWRAQGLDGTIRVDEMLLNFHFDDLNDRFARPLPKLHVSFAALPSGSPGEFSPGEREIRLPLSFSGADYSRVGRQVDDALLHAMVHADLYYAGRPWEHGSEESRKEFDTLAQGVGASPES